MILAVDVAYCGSRAVAAGVLFRDWADSAPAGEIAVAVPDVAPYEPGAFYKRELPCILQLLRRVEPLPDVVIVDGHVYLDAQGRPGLGRRLYDALEGRCAVIGLAKSRFRDTPPEAAVFRGGSRRPLFVTAAGMAEDEARRLILCMHGDHRLPTLLLLAHRRAKDGLASRS